MDTLTGAVGNACVSTAMHTFPKTCGPATTVAQAHGFFANPKVHALLVVDDGELVAVVERADLADDDRPGAPVAPAGTLAGRVVAPGDDLQRARDAMSVTGRRRLAVVADGLLVGLLCLKRSGRGFCSDAGVQARIDERAALAARGG
ncbi:CBS domain-containing protein [Pseudonocardia sp. HH130630-07]|uniref:CBS domain-containing protein n=1 Tax=Pseudonocardia sp. HH130630-07 TaxID=1690815 RepID=UPI0008152C1D|nr:CBS domain-containing protein [Pseudonocardia sp. HH130630-07]ANY07093.1 hypothetical protein AFB00_13255 [Pseudonocardia sp. HH130630-07]